MRIVSHIILGLLLLGGLLGVFVGGSGGRFDDDYAPGATANEVHGIRRMLGSASLAIIAAIGIAVNAILASTAQQTELLREMLIIQRRQPGGSSRQPTPSGNGGRNSTGPAAVEIIGIRPGETPEAWAKRVQDEEAQAFKAHAKV